MTRIPNHRNICSKVFCNIRDGGDERARDKDYESREQKRKKKGVIVESASATPTRLNERRHTGDESSPCNERNDGAFAARREPEVDEIVISFCGFLGSQERRSF